MAPPLIPFHARTSAAVFSLRISLLRLYASFNPLRLLLLLLSRRHACGGSRLRRAPRARSTRTTFGKGGRISRLVREDSLEGHPGDACSMGPRLRRVSLKWKAKRVGRAAAPSEVRRRWGAQGMHHLPRTSEDAGDAPGRYSTRWSRHSNSAKRVLSRRSLPFWVCCRRLIRSRQKNNNNKTVTVLVGDSKRTKAASA